MAARKFDVGGVLLNQPFKIRRLGHFGLNLLNMEEGLRFYRDLLGFKVSDAVDFAKRIKDRDKAASLGDPNGYFMRYGTDHHSFVLFNRRLREAMGRDDAKPGLTINQITWQVGSLRELNDGVRWFERQGTRLLRTGRDMPGSNWHVYLFDPDDHINELYYGMEQVGWDGYSKPREMYDRAFHDTPELPQISEYDEVRQALDNGVDLHAGRRDLETMKATFDVDGIILPRPFKIVRIGPLGLFVRNLEAAFEFYRDTLGFVLTDEAEWKGHRCLFLRAGTEHHALGLYPMSLREELGFKSDSSLMSFGLQLANYRQLRHAVTFLREHGAQVVETVPPDLCPGVDYAAHVLDPDGHCLMLYYYMEQVGWDGKPRPGKACQTGSIDDWPETIHAHSDAYHGEPFLGPWG